MADGVWIFSWNGISAQAWNFSGHGFSAGMGFQWAWIFRGHGNSAGMEIS